MNPNLIIVGDPRLHYERWSEQRIVVVQPMYSTEGRSGISARKRGIEHAMYNAVRASRTNDLIIQDDVFFTDDSPWDAPATEGAIRTFTRAWQHPWNDTKHYCPQAFMYYDIATRNELLRVWHPQRKNIPHRENACRAWGHIPKLDDYLIASHREE